VETDRTTSSPTNGTGRETRRNGGIDDDLACMFGYSLERHHRAIVLSVQLPRDLPFLPYSGLHCRISSRMASLSPVTAGRPVGEARFVREILLPVRTPSLRRVFHDSDHAECLQLSRILGLLCCTCDCAHLLYLVCVSRSLCYRRS